MSVHWGEEFLDYPSASQVVFAHKLVDAGASLILGHHPHVLQGIERYNGSVIAYSLGNFVFDMWQSPTRMSMVLKVHFVNSKMEFEAIPAYINSSFQPALLEGVERQKCVAKLAALDNKIRRNYLDRSVDGWSADEVQWSETEYTKRAKLMTQRHRLENYTFFLTHLHQYKGSIVRQSLSRFFSRRVEEITAKS